MIYRYLDKKYIDEFFNNGVLRLSSFKRFHKHKDEQRSDPDEGKAISVIGGPDLTAYVLADHGSNALVMSTSDRYSRWLKCRFGVDGCFAIENPPQFALAISRQLPGCVGGVEGPCLYHKQRVIENDDPTATLADFGVGQSDGLSRLGTTLHQTLGDDAVFLKAARFRHQREYRLAWFQQGEAPETITVICPEAARFCRRMD